MDEHQHGGEMTSHGLTVISYCVHRTQWTTQKIPL